jgi:uncharacterized tellurite resistance protein B-like protein
MPRKLPKGGKKSAQPFSPEEAIAAIGLVTMAADGTVEDVESEALVEVLQEIEFFEEYSEEEFDDLLSKIVSIGQDEGVDVLLNSSVEALSNKDYKEAALMTAFLIVSADEDVPAEEEEYLGALQGLLGISDDRYDELLEELFGEEDDEDEEEEE